VPRPRKRPWHLRRQTQLRPNNLSHLEEIELAAATEGSVPDRKDLAAFAFERTRMPLTIVNARLPDYPIVMANRAFLDLTGYNGTEVLGRNCRFLQGTETSQVAVAALRSALSRHEEANVEILNYRKDGSKFWNQLFISPIFDEKGLLTYYFASQIDVTDYRRVQSLEASEHRLLMEVDHRSRNVLAVVDGIVRLSQAENASQYASSVQERVQALVRAHTLLSEQGWREVGLDQILDRIISPFAREQVNMAGPDVMIAPQLVQPLALVFHELAVNAVTHGSLRSREGHVSIEWTPSGLAAGFNLVWHESGVTAAPRLHRPGFGTVMTRAIIEKQLNGEIAYAWHEQGLEISVDVPGQSA
jgi:PAS domain S-box-containing protein